MPVCALSVNHTIADLGFGPGDAASIGCETDDTLRLTTSRASAEVVVEISKMMTT